MGLSVGMELRMVGRGLEERKVDRRGRKAEGLSFHLARD